MFNRCVVAAAALFPLVWAQAATRQAGPEGTPGRKYRTLCQAIAAASDGDTVEIDAAGTYAGDVCGFTRKNLTIRGVNGRPRIDAAGKAAPGNGIWVINGDNNVVENVEFSGAAVPARNAAGIRLESGSLTIRNCYFHDNENGVLTAADASSHVLIEYSEFANNGAGDGLSHNMYIGHVGKFTLRYCYSRDARVGHLVKSRAAENHILYNLLASETSDASYELNLPNGGASYVIGNVIYQGPASANGTVLSYGEEGRHPANPDARLYVVHNTFVNKRPGSGFFIFFDEGLPEPPVVRNNIFAGTLALTNYRNLKPAGNVVGTTPGFAGEFALDFRLAAGSPAIGAGLDLPVDLKPTMQYRHPACAAARANSGPRGHPSDAGAYGFGGATPDSGAANEPERCRRQTR